MIEISNCTRLEELQELRRLYALLAAELEEERAQQYWATVRATEYFEPPK